jgi:two-component system copper resistance phosphate regulon response regulator CusR
MYKVLIIEDEQKMAQMLKRAFEEEAYEVDVAYDGYVGKRFALENEYDAIILDINLPLLNGYEVSKEIRKQNKSVPILMLTAFGAMENKLAGFEAGIDDYITKPFEFKELLARIKVFIRRKGNDNETRQILRVANIEMNLYTRTVNRGGKQILLTSKEFQLLEYFMRNVGRVISKAELADKIWEINFETGTNTIEVFVNYLRKKVDKDFSPKLIHTVVNMGYIIKEEE